jgi:membrane associated rhomboid family serine protease
MADPRGTVPCIEASGGISGILACYCLGFPRASVGIIYWFRWFRLPAGILFALWVLTQITDAFWISAGNSNVAVFAHLGGAAVGVLFWLWNRRLLSVDTAPPLTQPARTP